MALHRRIHRQQQLRIAVTGAHVIDILLRHLDEPLAIVQPALLGQLELAAPVGDPVDVHLLLVDGPAVLGVAGERGVDEGVVVLVGDVHEAVGLRLEVAGGVVAAAVLVLREGVLHAVVVQEVGGVVVVVEVLPAPEVSLEHFPGPDPVAARRVLAVFGAVVEVKCFLPRHQLRQRGFAVAECGAQVVAVGAGDWTFADEAGDVVRCEDTGIDLVAPASRLDWGGEYWRDDGEGEEKVDCRHC